MQVRGRSLAGTILGVIAVLAIVALVLIWLGIINVRQTSESVNIDIRTGEAREASQDALRETGEALEKVGEKLQEPGDKP